MVATALFIASLSTIAVSASTIPNNTVSDLWNLALDIETGKDNSTVQGGKAPEDVISMPEVFLEHTIDIDSLSESDIVNLVNVKVPSEVKVMFDNKTVIETNTSVPESSTVLDTTLANTKTTLSNEESTTKATEPPSSTVPTIKATPWTKPGSEDIVDNLIDIDSLDESDILDIVKNFIADKDPLLEVILRVHLSLCLELNFNDILIEPLSPAVPEPVLPPPCLLPAGPPDTSGAPSSGRASWQLTTQQLQAMQPCQHVFMIQMDPDGMVACVYMYTSVTPCVHKGKVET